MEINELIQNVKSKEDFIEFISQLLKDLEVNHDECKVP
jgi:predicted transcriptional regulator